MPNPGEHDQPRTAEGIGVDPAEMEEILDAIDDHLVTHTQGLDRHTQQIAAMTQQLNKLTDMDKNGEPKVPHLQRFRFERVEPELAAAAQDELAAWVPWLVTTFGLEDQVPPCWARHDGLSEELAGLYLGWSAAWSTDSDPSGPLVWHERLYRFRDRARAWGHGVSCNETRCGLDVQMIQSRLGRWLTGNQRLHQEGHTADAYRLHRARSVLPAPIPATAPKATTPAPGSNGKAAAAAGSN